MDKKTPPSLVEALEALPRWETHPGTCHLVRDPTGDYLDRDDVLKLAAPYAARLAALEKVAELAKSTLNMTMCPQGEDELLEVCDARRLLREALAAVPEIPEKTDG